MQCYTRSLRKGISSGVRSISDFVQKTGIKFLVREGKYDTLRRLKHQRLPPVVAEVALEELESNVSWLAPKLPEMISGTFRRLEGPEFVGALL